MRLLHGLQRALIPSRSIKDSPVKDTPVTDSRLTVKSNTLIGTVVSSVPFDRARPHHLPEVRSERTNEMGSCLQHVQERAPGGRPAVGCEEVLLPVSLVATRLHLGNAGSISRWLPASLSIVRVWSTATS